MTSPESARETRLSRFFHDYREQRSSSGSRLRCVLDRPGPTLVAAVDLFRLPRLTMVLGDSREAEVIRRAVTPAWSPLRLLPHAAVLELPRTAQEYLHGASKQTLRRKVRKARQLGITWHVVDDLQERQHLIDLADHWERNTPRTVYRNPSPSHDGLVDIGLWLVARSADGRPLVLSVTPVDGEWAALHYFRSIGIGDEPSLARYYLMTILVERLIAVGVRHLFNAGTPIRHTNGLRHYQRMIGFRNFRLRVTRRRDPRARAASSATPDNGPHAITSRGLG